MFKSCSNSQLLRRVLWISAEQTIGASLKHKNTQPLYIFNRENPQNSQPQNGPRSGLDYIALYLPTVDIGLGIPLLLHIIENLHIVDISSTTYLPRLVNVVKERPPKGRAIEKRSSAWAQIVKTIFLVVIKIVNSRSEWITYLLHTCTEHKQALCWGLNALGCQPSGVVLKVRQIF